MRPWFALVKALLNVHFGISTMRARLGARERVGELALIAVGLVFAAGAMLSVVVLYANALLDAGLALGQPELVLTLAHLGAALVVFFFGVAFVIGTMYFAGDTARLLVLPLRPWQIVSAKFVTILAGEYLTLFVLLVPIYVLYAIKVPVTAWYALGAAVTFLVTPIVPLGLATLLAMVLMRLVGGTRRRDLFTMIGGILGLALAIGLQFFFRSQVPSGSEAEWARMLFERAHGISEMITRGYPPGLWAMQSVALAGSASGWLALLKQAAVAAVVFGGLLLLGEGIFLRAVQSGGEAASRRGKATVAWRSASAVRAIARAECKLFLRTPSWVINGLAGFVVLPVLLFLPAGAGGTNIAADLRSLPIPPGVVILIIAGWYAFAGGMSLIAGTTFSREGSRLWILKSQPVPGRTLWRGKLLGDLTLTLVGALPGTAVVMWLLGTPLVTGALGILLGSALTVLLSLIYVAIDMMRPWLDWTDPTHAVKRNANTTIDLGATVAVLGILVLIGFGLVKLGAGLPFLVGAAFIVVPLAIAGVWAWIDAHCETWLARMGDR